MAACGISTLYYPLTAMVNNKYKIPEPGAFTGIKAVVDMFFSIAFCNSRIYVA